MSIGAPPVGSPQLMTTPGSLSGLMDGLTALQAVVPDHPALAGFSERLSVARWQPNQPDLPGLWNWLLPSNAELKDLSRMRDVFNVATRIATRFTDTEDRMALIEAAVDAYRAVVDPSFWDGSTTPSATKGWATWAMRSQLQSWSGDVGGVPVVGIEIVQTFWADRRIA